MIYATAIISGEGKPLIVRSFTHENKSELEGQLNAFPKLVQNASNNFIDTDSIRFVFQEMGDGDQQFYLVLIVSKDSNIIEVLDSVSLFSDLTRSIIGDITMENILNKGIDLILAYDECVFNGLKENVTLQDVLTNLKMESVEEAQALRIRAQQEAAAAATLANQIQAIHSGQNISNTSFDSSYSGTGQEVSIPTPFIPSSAQQYSPPQKSTISHGMSIGVRSRNEKAKNILEAELGKDAMKARSAPKVSQETKIDRLTITFHETLTSIISSSNIIKSFVIKGQMEVQPPDDDQKLSAVITFKPPKNSNIKKFTMKPMQQSNPKRFIQRRELVFNDPNISNPIPFLLGWLSKDESFMPLEIGVWITSQASKGITTLSCDVSLKEKEVKVKEVSLSFPVPGDAQVKMCDGKTENEDEILRWKLDPQMLIEKDQNSIEFAIPFQDDESLFYPIQIDYKADTITMPLEIESVTKFIETKEEAEEEEKEDIPFNVNYETVSKKFEIEEE